jgi:serine/threonine protein kinase/tetratricopeptide (TPR) repeat protein
MIGTQVHQFKILEKIGEGGMGEVYLAQDTRLERKVALKFLPPNYSADPDFKARFEHEAKATAALNHPNIITVHEMGEHEGRLFIAMELIEGQTLESLISGGDVSLTDAIKTTIQICGGLSAAHDAGVVHRDIKPANIFITKDGRAKILDFGLAKSRKATTDTKVGTTVGTVQYESPEQSRGDKVDARSDLFSLGVVLYELITAQRPFKGEFEDAIKYAIANENPEPLARYKTDVSDDVQRVVSKLLEKDPEVRYQSAAGVVSDLKLIQRASGPSTVHSAYHSAIHAGQPEKKSGSLTKLLVPSVAAVAIVFLLLVFKPWSVTVEGTNEATAAEDRLAVMYFDNLTDPNDEQRQGEVVSSLLISDLSESQYMQVVSSQRLYDILKNMGKEGSRRITPDVATEVAEKANARWMLTGKILSSEPTWVVQAELSDVATGDLISSPSISGQPGERIFEVIDRLTREIKANLALPAEALAELDKPVIELTTESSDAYRLYLEGEELKYRFRMAEAEEKYREALQYDSTFAMAYIGIQLCRVAYWGDFLGGRQAARKAYEFIDNTTGRDSLFISSVNSFYAGQTEPGLRSINALIEKYPEDKEALEFLGNVYQHNDRIQDLSKAVKMHRRILDMDPLWTSSYNALAYAYEEMGDLEQSLWAINKYVELQPDEPNPYDSRGEIQAQNGQFEEALASYLKALDVKPDFLPSMMGAFGLSMHLGHWDTAKRLVAEMQGHENPAIRSRGMSLEASTALHQGRIQDGLKIYADRARFDAKQSETRPRLAGAHFNRAYLLSFLGETDKALDELDAALRVREETLSPEEARESIWDDRINILARGGRLSEADSILQLLAGTIGQPNGADSGLYWRLKHNILFEAEEYDSAIVYFEKGAGSRSSFYEHVRLGRCYAGARKLRDAQSHFEQAEGIYDGSRRNNAVSSVLYYYWRAQVYEKSGKTQQALADYQKFLEIWKNSDQGLKEVDDAKRRLAKLQA